MSPGRHAASDASFVRSAGGAATRGIILIVFAVVIGVVLIATAVDDNGTVTAAQPPETTAAPTPPSSTEAPTDTTAAVDPTQTSEDPTATTASTEPDPATTDTTATTSPGAVFSARPPGEVMVQVVNTTRIGGAAGKATDTLKTQGYNTLDPSNDDGGLLTDTKVHHIGGYLLEAQAIATVLGLDPETSVLSMPDNVGAGIDNFLDAPVLVRLGNDLADS